MSGAVLVTGATGCLGSALTRALVTAGERVAILKRPGESLAALDTIAAELDVRLGDVTDPASLADALRGITFVYHLAGIVVPLNSAAELMWRVNTVGSSWKIDAVPLPWCTSRSITATRSNARCSRCHSACIKRAATATSLNTQ